ncbi:MULTISPECIES: NUDIX domain-containing protein [Arthrobacter]|uniref:NUDIX domain-containing protein n=2 Tax=Arthrobacter TaxID=1663 RepID=A0ABU9KL72_9MICC|nr:NUDIX domain-containing protein [Arthrobacter sp. YJM1]MDP5227588.1 NUDIX domain-containing protein [Arthrobacter sp. YJM1]
MTLLDSAIHAITSWDPRNGAEEKAKADFVSALDHGEAVLSRHPLPTHLTASAFVLDRGREFVLLVFHRKGRFWVQPGGHLEDDDASVESAALREAREETGLAGDLLHGARVVDLDHHALAGAFGHCRSHLDIGVVVFTDGTPAPTVSDESEAVRWFPVNALPDGVVNGFRERLDGVLARLG